MRSCGGEKLLHRIFWNTLAGEKERVAAMAYVMANEQIEILQSEKAVIDLLARALLESPKNDWLESLVAEGVFESAHYADNQPETEEGLRILKEWARQFTPENDTTASDYLRLFIGPGKPLAPPWESVFLSEGGLLFQEETLEVRTWFKAYGVESKKLYHEPDDHISLELEFISHLTNMAIKALEQDDGEKARQLLDARAEFLEKHLLRWAFTWCTMVKENAGGLFYRGVAHLVCGVLRELGNQ